MEREYSVKIAETVYGSLYREAKWVLLSLEQKQLAPINFEQWGQSWENERLLSKVPFNDNADVAYSQCMHAIVTPIYETSVFAFSSTKELIDVIS